jgi:hypothetical protein
MTVDTKMVKRVIKDVLEDANIQVIDPNDLLFKHTEHIASLEKKFAETEKLVKTYEIRLGFVEQLARKAIAYVESEPYEKGRKAAEKTLQESYKLAKFAEYVLEELKGLPLVKKRVPQPQKTES